MPEIHSVRKYEMSLTHFKKDTSFNLQIFGLAWIIYRIYLLADSQCLNHYSQVIVYNHNNICYMHSCSLRTNHCPYTVSVLYRNVGCMNVYNKCYILQSANK